MGKSLVVGEGVVGESITIDCAEIVSNLSQTRLDQVLTTIAIAEAELSNGVEDCTPFVLASGAQHRDLDLQQATKAAIDKAKKLVGYKQPTDKRNRAGKRLKGWDKQ